MKFNLKEYFKISVIYTLIGALGPIIQIFVQPIIEGENRLGAIDFSHLAITETIASLAYILTLFSMSTAIARFYYDFNNNTKEQKRLIASIFNSILLRGIILLSIVLLFGKYIGNIFTQEELKQFTSYGFAAVIIGINRSVIATAGALFRNEKNIKLFVLMNIMLTVLRTGLQIAGLFLYEMSFLGYIYGTVIGTSFTSVTILIIIYLRTGFKHDIKLMKEVNRFASPLFQYGFIAWMLTFADRYFLEKMPIQLGIYNTAISFALGIQIILQGLQGATQPELFGQMKEGIIKKSDEIKKISNIFLLQAQSIIVFAMLPAILFLLIFYETDIRLASGIIAIMFIRQIIIIQYQIFSIPLYYLKKTKLFLYINLITLILNLSLNILLIPKLGFYGAIIAALLSSLLQLILIYIYQQKIIKISWNKNKVLIFPLSIFLLTCIIQLVQILFELTPLIGASCIAVYFIFGVWILYKKEINSLWAKYIIK